MANLDRNAAWTAIQSSSAKRLLDLFAAEADRTADFSRNVATIHFDWSKTHLDGELLSSFEQVNKHFQHLFTQLFGGGTAELQLIESDDPLEAGLEILARPPGKKPQTMTLLSGG